MEKILPIGVIDSGKGGEGIIHYLSFNLNNENFLLYKDQKNFPYGNKSRNEIITIGNNAIETIQDKVKLIVIGCNTLSCFLESKVDIKILKINECIIEKITKLKIKKRILFLTTNLTKRSNYFQNKCDELGFKYSIISCSTLVNMIEENKINKEEIKRILNNEIVKDYDAIVLGCTHFYYLEEQIKKLFPGVYIVTGFDIMEKHIKHYFKKHKLKNKRRNNTNITVIKT